MLYYVQVRSAQWTRQTHATAATATRRDGGQPTGAYSKDRPIMIDRESGDRDHHADGGPAAGMPGIRTASWRYCGDRAAADVAYCARFGVTVSPEPYALGGGVWAYVLPGAAPPR